MAKRRGSSRRERKNDIGKYLTEIRVAQGKTQQEVADDLRKSRYLICRMETGDRTKKSLEGIILYEVAKAYGASVVEILKRAESVQLPLIRMNGNNEEIESSPLLDITDEEQQELILYLSEIRQKKVDQPPATH